MLKGVAEERMEAERDSMETSCFHLRLYRSSTCSAWSMCIHWIHSVLSVLSLKSMKWTAGQYAFFLSKWTAWCLVYLISGARSNNVFAPKTWRPFGRVPWHVLTSETTLEAGRYHNITGSQRSQCSQLICQRVRPDVLALRQNMQKKRGFWEMEANLATSWWFCMVLATWHYWDSMIKRLLHRHPWKRSFQNCPYLNEKDCRKIDNNGRIFGSTKAANSKDRWYQPQDLCSIMSSRLPIKMQSKGKWRSFWKGTFDYFQFLVFDPDGGQTSLTILTFQAPQQKLLLSRHLPGKGPHLILFNLF